MKGRDYLVPGERPNSLTRWRALRAAWEAMTSAEQNTGLVRVLWSRRPPDGDGEPLMRITKRWAEKQAREVLEVYAWVCLNLIPPFRQDDLIAALHRNRRKGHEE